MTTVSRMEHASGPPAPPTVNAQVRGEFLAYDCPGCPNVIELPDGGPGSEGVEADCDGCGGIFITGPVEPRATAPATRKVRIFRLDVTLPPGSEKPGWQPPGFSEGGFTPDGTHYGGKDARFHWPRRRIYIDQQAACRRARLLESWGATVEIRPSDPVTWPGDLS